MIGGISATRRQFLAGAVASGALLGAPYPLNKAWAAFPDRKVNIIVPTREGGGSDRDVRLFTAVWRKYLKADFSYEFYPGAAGQVGYEIFHGKKDADAYNLLFANLGPEVIMQVLQKPKPKLGKDFIYFFLISSEVMALWTAASSKFKTVEQLVEEGRKRTVTISVSRIPHPASLGCLALAEATGAKFQLVPYGGGNPSSMAAITGETDASALPFAQPLRLGDQARVLATFGRNSAPEMSANAPAVNSVFGTKIPELNSSRGFGIHTGAIERFPDRFAILKESMAKVAEDPDYPASVEKAGLPRAFVSFGDQQAAMQNAVEMQALAEKFAGLLTGRK